MWRIMLKSKIHRATVTSSNLHYEGSITIDEDLMEASSIVPFEQVHIYNISNGNRFVTYAIPGKRGSGEICMNGAAARKAFKGDLIIIASYAMVEDREILNYKPRLVYVNERNEIVDKNQKG